MPDTVLSETYFIALMMVLILILSTVATYLFFKTYYAEKRMWEEERKAKKRLKEQELKAEQKAEVENQ